ncbi:hypothetical protein L596_015778 [Steinernema carpocapsae]|uniref:Uncharacterized protein n=1 Tax=Steinernema carpocapsae TaxID=34508 RepID=A0A4U5NGZ3_STECR|nr:hypothetical protein L596_015778 [Steinernema carpocapsae]
MNCRVDRSPRKGRLQKLLAVQSCSRKGQQRSWTTSKLCIPTILTAGILSAIFFELPFPPSSPVKSSEEAKNGCATRFRATGHQKFT